MVLIQLILAIHTATNRIRPIIEQVVMQLSITAAKLLLLQEEAIVHERQRIKNVQLGLFSEDKRIVDERVEAGLEDCLVDFFGESCFRGVVEEVGYAEDVVDGVVFDNGGFDAEKGEEVGDFLVIVLGS